MQANTINFPNMPNNLTIQKASIINNIYQIQKDDLENQTTAAKDWSEGFHHVDSLQEMGHYS